MVSHEDLDNAVAEHEAGLEDSPAEETPQGEAGETEELTEETEVNEEEESEPEVPDEPDDNAERSRLGRRVSAVEDTLQKILTAVEKPKEKVVEEEIDDDEFISRKELDSYLDRRERKRIEAEQQYTDSALAALVKQGQDLPDDDYAVIVEDARKNWKRHTNNPEYDAMMNFLDAQNRALKKMVKSGKPKNPLEKNKDVKLENLGGPSGDAADTKPVKAPKLDKYAAEFAKRTGMSDKKVAEVLSREMPLSLGSGGKFSPK